MIKERRTKRSRRFRFNLRIYSYIRHIFNRLTFRGSGKEVALVSQNAETVPPQQTSFIQQEERTTTTFISQAINYYFVQNNTMSDSKFEFNFIKSLPSSLPIDFDKLKFGAVNGILMTTTFIIVYQLLTTWFLYPIFRLLFGTLYPAYASYKAVKTKNVKEYVSTQIFFKIFLLFLN